MGRPIKLNPKVDSNGDVIQINRYPADLRAAAVAIAQRRGETLQVVLNKALEQYVAADRRRPHAAPLR